MILLDTHVWLWWLNNSDRLSKSYKNQLNEMASLGELAVSWTSLWEVETLVRKNKIQIHTHFDKWLDYLTNPILVSIEPVSKDIIRVVHQLPESFSQDPGDRLIISTAILKNYFLASFDSKIIDSGLVKMWNPKA
jgi:PIN domain nuclease of toxin-antitoxin system